MYRGLFVVFCCSGGSSSCASFMAFMQASNSLLPNAMAEQSLLFLLIRLHISSLDVFPLSLQFWVRTCVLRSKGVDSSDTYTLVPAVPHRVCCSFKSPAGASASFHGLRQDRAHSSKAKAPKNIVVSQVAFFRITPLCRVSKCRGPCRGKLYLKMLFDNLDCGTPSASTTHENLYWLKLTMTGILKGCPSSNGGWIVESVNVQKFYSGRSRLDKFKAGAGA